MLQSPISDIIDRLHSLPYSNNIYVVGSVARGDEYPKDLDIVVFLSEPYNGPAQLQKYSGLLRLAHRYYGWFDPYLSFSNRLFTRNDSAFNWKVAKNTKQLETSFREDKKPLRDFTPKIEEFSIRRFLNLVDILNEQTSSGVLINPSKQEFFRFIYETKVARMGIDDEGNVYIWNAFSGLLHSDVNRIYDLSKTGKENPLTGLSLYAFENGIGSRSYKVGDGEIIPKLTEYARQLRNVRRIWGRDVVVFDMHGEP